MLLPPCSSALAAQRRAVFILLPWLLLLAHCNQQPPGAPAKDTAPVAQSTAPASGSTAPENTPPAAENNAPAPGTVVEPRGSLQTALLAGGCFWGMEEILRKIPGVLQTEVGYTGGRTPAPRYQTVSTGTTGHAESVRIVFDPQVLSYADLLEQWFFRMHDPTTRDRQGNDRGSQYRSAIFFTSPEQEQVARDVIRRVEASKKWPAPIVTEVAPAGEFTVAEAYHQDYLQKNPGGYTCHYLRD